MCIFIYGNIIAPTPKKGARLQLHNIRVFFLPLLKYCRRSFIACVCVFNSQRPVCLTNNPTKEAGSMCVCGSVPKIFAQFIMWRKKCTNVHPTRFYVYGRVLRRGIVVISEKKKKKRKKTGAVAFINYVISSCRRLFRRLWWRWPRFDVRSCRQIGGTIKVKNIFGANTLSTLPLPK